MPSSNTKLTVLPRSAFGTRAARRLRRDGLVPGVLYGQGVDSTPIQATVQDLRQALTATGAVIELTIDGDGKGRPVVVKDVQRDPVRGDLTHIDFLVVRLDEEITAPVPVELINAEEGPGVKEGGVLEQVTRELNVEALPTAIPDSITVDVSEMKIAETLMLKDVPAPPGVTLLDDLEETVIATITAPTELEEPEEIEEEIELVGEEAEEAAVEGEEEAPAEAAEEGREGAGREGGGGEGSRGEG